MARTRRLEIVLAGDASGALRALGATDVAASRTGGRFARIGPIIAGVGVAAAGAAVVAGKALYDIGATFDDAYDQIRVGTGATGRDLEALQGVFRNVARTSYSSMDQAATAVTGLNQRLGLTGRPLERLSGQFVDLSRITDTDLSSNIENITRVFGDWGVNAREMPDALDRIYRASQSSGIGIDQLTAQVVQFGAPLRNMGFELDESLALFAKWEQEGVNIETAMSGMRKAVGTFASDGIAPMEGFQRVMSDVEAGTFSMSDAIEIFGARAGPDMYAALTEGRFGLDEMLDSIRNGRDTIADASRDTADFSEKWQNLKNRVFLALEPVATRVFQAVSDGMDDIGPAADRLVGWFQRDVLPTVRRVWPQISAAVDENVTRVRAVIDAGVELAQTIWARFGDNILSHVNRVWPAIRQTVGGALNVIRGVIETVTAIISGDWSDAWDGIKRIFAGAWDAIAGTVRVAVANVQMAVGVAWDLVGGIFRSAWGGITNAFREIWGGIVGLVRDRVETAKRLVTGAWNRVRDVTRTAWAGIRQTVGGAWTFIGDRLRALRDFAVDVLSAIWNPFRRATTRVWDEVKSKIMGVLRHVGNGVSGFLRVVATIADKVGLDAVAGTLRTAATGADSWGETRGGDGPGAIRRERTIGAPAFPTARSGLISRDRGPDPSGGINADSGTPRRSFAAQLADANPIDVARRVLAGLVESTWPRLSLSRPFGFALPEIAQFVPAGINRLRQSAIDMLRGAASESLTKLAVAGQGKGVEWMMATLRRRFPGLPLISGLRPGAVTATGNRSYHSMGRAVDVPPRMDVFDWIWANYGPQTKELIFSPAGHRQIHNGAPHWYGEPTRGDHWDHVHWAMADGGAYTLRRPTRFVAGEAGPEDAVFVPHSQGGLPALLDRTPDREIAAVVAREVARNLNGLAIDIDAAGRARLVVAGLGEARRRGMKVPT